MSIGESLLIAIVFVLYSCTNSNKCDDMTRNDVCITIMNHTFLKINSLIIIHKTGREERGPMGSKSQTKFKFHSPGENSFYIISIAESGDTLKSSQIYTEGG